MAFNDNLHSLPNWRKLFYNHKKLLQKGYYYNCDLSPQFFKEVKCDFYIAFSCKKNILARFISFIDVLYENKNILSISSNVGLDELYIGNTNFSEFKRTISRLKEMGTNKYINKNLTTN